MLLHLSINIIFDLGNHLGIYCCDQSLYEQRDQIRCMLHVVWLLVAAGNRM
jgi:hypothetical protein